MYITEEKLKRLKEDLERVQKALVEFEYAHRRSDGVISLIGGTRESGALRRASMDLTRSLARLRSTK
jgi:hypothetical protein